MNTQFTLLGGKVMPVCPECGSTDIFEDLYSPEEKYDGLGNSIVIHYYTCNDCGCEWEARTEINRHIEITRHGKEQKKKLGA